MSFKLDLNDYQAANLYWLLALIHDGNLNEVNTGDWVGELRWQLKDHADALQQKPNISIEDWLKVHRP